MQAKTTTESVYYVSTIEGLVTPDDNALYLFCEHLIQDLTPKYKNNVDFMRYKLDPITLANLKYIKSCPDGSALTNLNVGENLDRLEHELLALQKYADDMAGTRVQIFIIDGGCREYGANDVEKLTKLQ